jgi:hypothetical protein
MSQPMQPSSSSASELLGKLLPGHPDIFPIIQNIREKYGIPEIRPEDDIAEILLMRDDIHWDAVKKDIDEQVRNIPFFTDTEQAYFQTIKTIQSFQYDGGEFAALSPKMQQSVKQLISVLMQPHALAVSVIEEKTYTPVAEMILEYLMTGKTRDVPEEWFGKVFVSNMFGDKVVIAIAGEATNPNHVAEQLKSEMNKTFGEYKLDVTDTYLETAEFLMMELQGDSLERRVERYEEKYPNEFPPDKDSEEYKIFKRKIRGNMKKQLYRLKKFLKRI